MLNNGIPLIKEFRVEFCKYRWALIWVGFHLLVLGLVCQPVEASQPKPLTTRVLKSTNKRTSPVGVFSKAPASVSSTMEYNAGSRLHMEFKQLVDPTLGYIPANIRNKELMYASTLPKTSDLLTNRRSGNWIHRGPYYIGGRTRALGLDVLNPKRILAGSVSGGIWLSEDGGKSWRTVQEKNQLRSATCLVQDIRNGKENVWICGSGEAYGQSASAKGAYYLGDGLFISYDGGITWNPIESTTSGSAHTFSIHWQLVWNLAIDQTAANYELEIYSANYQNVMRSVDSGRTWKAWLSGCGYFTDVALTTSGTVYATSSSDGTKKGMFRAANNGNPINITPPNFGKNFNRIVIGIDPNNENRVYFLCNNDDFGKKFTNFRGDVEWNGLWRYTYIQGDGSKDSGIWEDLTKFLPVGPGLFDQWNVQGSYDMLVKVQPGDSNCVYIGGTNLYRTRLAFADSVVFSMIGGYLKGIKPGVRSASPFFFDAWPNHHPDQHHLVFDPLNPYSFINANDGGLFRCNDTRDDSIVWESLNNGYLTTQFYSVALDHATPNSSILVAGAQDNNQILTVSKSRLADWKTVYPGDGSYCAVANGGKTFYFSKQQGRMLKAEIDDQGQRTKFRRIDPIGGSKYLFINPYILDPNNSNIMYLAGGKYLWRNNALDQIPLDNSADSISMGWTMFPDSIPLRNEWVTAIGVSTKPANRVYYGSSLKRIYRLDSAHTGIRKPVDISIPGLPNGYVGCIAVDPNNADRFLVSYTNYGVYSIWLTEDAGKTYTKVAGNLEQFATGLGDGPSVRWVAMLPVSDGMIYFAATSVGLYATDTLMGTSTVWVQQATGEIGNVVCTMLDTRVSDGTVALSTHGFGILSCQFNSRKNILGIQEWKQHSIGEFTLGPNPINAGEFIAADLLLKAHNEDVTWGWLNSEGKELVFPHFPSFEQLDSTVSNSSTKKIVRFQIKTPEVPGLYYLRCRIGNQSITKSVIVL